jgi:hypothetical protein
MSKLSKLFRDENGAGLLLCIFVLFVALGVGGLVVDMGILYKTKGEMRKAANAAVLSGAQVIFENNTTIVNTVDGILAAHHEENSKESLQIKPNGEYKVTTTLRKNVGLYFMKIFGITSAPVEVTSSAIVEPLRIGSGPVPIGLPDNINFQVDETYPLNLVPGEGISGNYNYLDFSSVKNTEGQTVPNPGTITNHGASALEEYLQHGYNGEIGLNYQIETKTGFSIEKIRDAINYRLSSPDPDNRIVMVILYDNRDQGNGTFTIHVTGFAYFQLERMEGKDNGKGKGSDKGEQVIGRFIRKVTTGSTTEGTEDFKSAYAIKLVE